MDFVIGLMIFLFALVVYFNYTTNFQKQETDDSDLMLSNAKAMSSALALSGYPKDWNNATVIRIGITDDQMINASKFRSLSQINYSDAKKKFPTTYDFFVYFADDSGNVLNINGICGAGSSKIKTYFSINTAYYYQDAGHAFLKDLMAQDFNADIFYETELSSLMSNLNKYGFIVMEDPLMSTSDYNNYRSSLNNYTSSGNLFLISGDLTANSGQSMLGVVFDKKSGQTGLDRNSTIIGADQYFSMDIGQNLLFAQADYVTNTSSAANFKRIAIFNQDNANAISRWNYGNGTAYFFSDIDVSNYDGSFSGKISDSSQSLTTIKDETCKPINTTNVNPKSLVNTERYLNYNSKAVKMVLYVWK